MVRARPARARADEARPPAPPVPRQVHPAARRDAARAVRAAAGGRVLDPFAGSGTTLVQSLESGRPTPSASTSPPSTACCRGQDGPLQRVRPRDARSGTPCSALATSGVRHRTWLHRPVVRAAGGRRAARLPLPDRRLRARRRPPRRARARGALGAADDALRPRLPARSRRSGRTGATSTSASAARSSAPSTSSAATRSTRSRGSRRSRASVTGTREAAILHGDARELELGGPLRRGDHLAAVPGPDRLPRAAPLRVRAARPRRPPRARGRRRGRGDEQGRDRRVLAGDRRGARERPRLAAPGRPGRDRRQRPPSSSTRRSSIAPASGSSTVCAGT